MTSWREHIMSTVRISLVLLVFTVLALQFLVPFTFAVVQEGEAASELSSAESALFTAYQAVLKPEEAGANVSGLLVRLNDAGRLLGAARMSFRNGDFDVASMLADLSEDIGVEVENEAVRLNASALDEGSRRIFLTVTASVVGVAAVGLGSIWVWHVTRKRIGQYRSWFIVGCLVLMLVIVAPASALYVHLPSGSESFSELWLLGPGHKAENYPFNIKVNETYSIYVGVGNRLGYSAYYGVFVKLRNQTQALPVNSNSTPSPLPVLYEYNFFARDSEIWETLLSFRVMNADRLNGSMNLRIVSINDVPFQVDSVSAWDVEREGFYFQLILELWFYNMKLNSFDYHNRFVGIWLNLTS